MQTKDAFFHKMNLLQEKKIPFFFIVDYLGLQHEVIPLDEIAKHDILFTTPQQSTTHSSNPVSKPLIWQKSPISKAAYRTQFNHVKTAIQAGDTYLINLTCSTPVDTNYSLREIFHNGTGKYQLFYRNKFTHFSPEPFVKIEKGRIYSSPMKGTIDASVKDAKSKILANEKELNEQFTIVDLIRNDLSIVANDVRVDKFRYVEKIETNQKELLAVSSKISGTLKPGFKNKLGDVFASLLPAGSITGAPKSKTMTTIAEAETHQRNYYTGVWGIFDGQDTDSCVIIRYLENTKAGLVFKSGGGITSMSDLDSEYQEMIDKVYVPVY